MLRKLKEAEKAAISRIANSLPDSSSRKQLLADIENAKVEQEIESRLEFHIGGYKRPPYNGQRSFGVPGEVRDKDGATIYIDLFADQNGRVLDLELSKVSTDPIVEPDWSSLKLFV